MGLTQVSTDGVKNDAITKVKIPANQIEASELADNAVDTNAIANNAVTAGKLASGVQTTINNNADNRVITGSGTANTLNAESNVLLSTSSTDNVFTTDSNSSRLRLFGGSNASVSNGAALTLHGVSNSSGNYTDLAAGTGGHIQFRTGTSERMRIDSSGQVGMGTSNPVQQAGRGLHINGTDQTRIKLTNSTSGATANDGFDIIQESDMDIHIINHENMAMKFGTNATERMRINSSGNLGIGTTNPIAPLHVRKDIAQSASLSTANQTFLLSNTGSDSTNNRTSIYFASYNSSNQLSPSAIVCLAESNYGSNLAFYTNVAGNGTGHLTSYERMRILSNGVVDIYSAYTNPVGGTTRDLYVRSDGRLGYLSSIRASKINIVDLTDISWLNNLKPQIFNVRKQNDSGEYTDSYYDELEYGLIAEDVESVNKELCSYSANNVLESVQYRKLVVPLLKAVQELTARVAALEAA